MTAKTDYEMAGALIIGNAGFLTDAYQGGYLDLNSNAVRNAFIGIAAMLKEREKHYTKLIKELQE